jgi:hypothetical protein
VSRVTEVRDEAGAEAGAVQASLVSLAGKEPDLRKPLSERGRWARAFTTAAYRLTLGREPDASGLQHHAAILDADPGARAGVLSSLAANKGAVPLAPVPATSLSRHTPAQVLASLHQLEQTGRRRDLYLAEVLAAVEALRTSLPDQVDAALARSAVVRGQAAADLAVAHLASARSFTSPGPDGVTVVDVGGLLLAVPGDDWALGARLALRGDPQADLTDHISVFLAQGRDRDPSEPLVVADLGSRADAGLAALRCARAGHRVHVVEADDRARALVAAAFALNDLEPAGVHASVAGVTEPVDAVRAHGADDLSGLAGLRLADGARAWTTGERPAGTDAQVRGVAGVPGAWELTAPLPPVSA